MKTPLNRVLGLGSAKDGTGHWWGQRVTAVALTILIVWMLASLLALGNASHEQVVEWVAAPWNSIALILLVGTLFYHSKLGVQVVIEDYVHQDGLKVVALLTSNLLHVVMAVAGIFAVVRISLGGS